MNEYLRLFHQNQGQREAVRAFLIDVLREMAVEKTFEGEPVNGIKDAKDCVDKMFNKLEELYGKVETKAIPNTR